VKEHATTKLEVGQIPTLAVLDALLKTLRDLFQKIEEVQSQVPGGDLPLEKAVAAIYKYLRSQMPKADHAEVQLDPLLANTRVLSECVKDINGDETRKMELAIQNNPHDTAAQEQLRVRTTMMRVRYSKEIKDRTSSPNLTRLVVEISHKGNDFRVIYDSIWYNKIANAESEAIHQYALLMVDLSAKEKTASRKTQPTESIVELYVEAAVVKPQFNAIVAGIKEQVGGNMAFSICALLKKVSRMVEKSELKGTKPADVSGVKDIVSKLGDVSGVKDIVRAMVVGKTMAEVNAVVRILLDLHESGALEIVRKKDRFLEAPSGGGWRDIMINILVTVQDGDRTVQHICEIQVVHHQMLNARREMDGHVVYNIVRNGEQPFPIPPSLHILSFCTKSPFLY